MINVKIENYENILKYVSMIRKYGDKRSIADIKSRITENDYVLEYDRYSSYDAYDDLYEIDRGKLFREFLDKLTSAGAKLAIYENDEEISLEYLDNIFQRYEEIEKEVEEDIERELGEIE